MKTCKDDQAAILSSQKKRLLTNVPLIMYLLTIIFAIFVYFYALDSQYAPKNGDEFPYAHITRLTAASGHLLPLQSELNHMRNTKPPLLFWQGIYSTAHGQHWTLWRLRFVSVIYTLLTAGLVGLLAFKLSLKQKIGYLASIIFLAFFSTYHYGRPFLVNPAETFWIFLPFFTLLYSTDTTHPLPTSRGLSVGSNNTNRLLDPADKPQDVKNIGRSELLSFTDTGFSSRVLPWIFGIEIGIGLLFKSFILIVPITAGLLWWYLHHRHYHLKPFLKHDVPKLIIASGLALALFSLWFVFDPNPTAIWHEFVIGENTHKFHFQEGNYLKTLLWSSSSIWTVIIGYPLNAGLLAFPVLGLMIHTIRFRIKLGDTEKMLWFWCILLLVFFCIPSQRSARYLLDAMPALAVLCGLNWHRINYYFFVPTLLATLLITILFGYLELHLQENILHFHRHNTIILWSLISLTTGLVLIGLFIQKWTRFIVNIVVLLVYLIFSTFLRPLDLFASQYSTHTIDAMKKVNVWVPCNFRASDEVYQFLLPNAVIHGYSTNLGLTSSELAGRYANFVIHLPIHQPLLNCPDCTIIARRLDLRSKHSPEEFKSILHGKIYENLFVQELLVHSPHAQQNKILEEGCR